MIPTSTTSQIEVLVIGAGVIGLAVARALAVAGKEVVIVDRASRIGSETSSRNSEVVHGGLYYPSSSLKAKFCVQGRQLLYDFCEDRNIFFKKCGKLVAATSAEQAKYALPDLLQQAQQNGVTSTSLISAEEVKNLEPEIQSYGALWSPLTGIVESHQFMLSLLAEAEDHGATLALQTTVTEAKVENEQIYVYAGGDCFSCKSLINCGGLWADEIAGCIHRNQKWKPPKQYFAKGSYFRLQGLSPFQHLIYPLPDPNGGLGVHATVDREGQVKFGPDLEWLKPNTKPDTIDYVVEVERAKFFHKAISKYWPNISERSLIPDYVGVRPKLCHPSQENGAAFQDFLIIGPETHGIDGLVHLLGIESPGLTSSIAIANHIANRIQV